jgi:hypothetical protein
MELSWFDKDGYSVSLIKFVGWFLYEHPCGCVFTSSYEDLRQAQLPSREKISHYH